VLEEQGRERTSASTRASGRGGENVEEEEGGEEEEE